MTLAPVFRRNLFLFSKCQSLILAFNQILRKIVASLVGSGLLSMEQHLHLNRVHRQWKVPPQAWTVWPEDWIYFQYLAIDSIKNLPNSIFFGAKVGSTFFKIQLLKLPKNIFCPNGKILPNLVTHVGMRHILLPLSSLIILLIIILMCL